jgi:hypothetical protein
MLIKWLMTILVVKGFLVLAPKCFFPNHSGRVSTTSVIFSFLLKPGAFPCPALEQLQVTRTNQTSSFPICYSVFQEESVACVLSSKSHTDSNRWLSPVP